MIKINLLGVAPPPPRLPMAGAPAPRGTQIMVFVGAMVISFGIVGMVYKILNNEIADLAKARNREVVRQSELALVMAQNAEYQQRLTDLETRINTIQALQNSRVGPVELMGALGYVVDNTRDVYLYTLAPSAGDRIQLRGQAGSVNSMANFLSFLNKSNTFSDIQLEQFYQDDQHEHLSYKFSLTCQFKSNAGRPSPTSGNQPAVPAGTATPVPAGTATPAAPGAGAQPSPPVPAGTAGAVTAPLMKR